MKTLLSALTLAAIVACSSFSWADEPQTLIEPPVPGPRKYTLRYKFQPGETIRWRVEHRSNIRTTISGTTQSAESTSMSVKVWKVTAVDDQGVVTFEHSVESVKMWQKNSGRQEITYDSLTDKVPPPVFEEAAKSVGVPLTLVKMDPLGKVVERQDKHHRPGASEEAQLTISLPEQPVAVGEKWSFPNEIVVNLKDEGLKRVKIRQQYTLTDVKNGVAVIQMETQVLTPIVDPQLQAQLVQRETTGEVRFDMEYGRITSQQIDLDKGVVGFAGPQSSLDCRTRFEESLLTDAPATARVPEQPAAANAATQQ